MLDDYEHSHGVGFGYPTWTILPQALAGTTVPCHPKTELLYYSGIKEEVYAPELRPRNKRSSFDSASRKARRDIVDHLERSSGAEARPSLSFPRL